MTMRRLVLPCVLLTSAALPALELSLLRELMPQWCALISPELQPGDLFERAQAVVILHVTAVDEEAHRVDLTVVRVCKGTFVPKTVSMTLRGDQPLSAFVKLMAPGVTVTALIGQHRRPLEMLFYAGGEGTWQSASMAGKDDTGHWIWSEDLGGHGPKSLFGTFNGSSERFAELMTDAASGRLYFPAAAVDGFAPDELIGRTEGPVRGVALYDVNGDQRPDIYACSPGGDRLWIQDASGKFTDKTVESGLGGVVSASVTAADVDGAGRPALLLNGTLWQQVVDGRYHKTDRLGARAAADVMNALFVDANGDGYPDVVVSHRNGGLTLHLNPGKADAPFLDITVQAGLEKTEAGAGTTGWVMAGDWTGDHRCSLFLSSGGGHLLVRGPDGVFSPAYSQLHYDFSGDGQPSGLTGAGCFAAVWKPQRQDLLFSRDSGLALAINSGADQPLDGVNFGNEIQLTSQEQLPLIAEDLNADGTVDIYIGSRGGKANMLYANRGYGSFMVPNRNSPKVFQGPAHNQGAWGLAAGDMNADGASDLLLGGIDGTVTLLRNICLDKRQPTEHPTLTQAILQRTRIVSVAVRGPLGVVGATVMISAADGRVLGRRDIGSNVATGCRGPDTVDLAVREPGACTVSVRWSDGMTRTWPITVDANLPRRSLIIAERPTTILRRESP